MSIHVTVKGNPMNIRPGKMVLTDLGQIKKNELDRRRRLRQTQVRQQSKEISKTLVDRVKNIVTEEVKKLQKGGKSCLREMENRKILEIQQKYQEDMADIGYAHACAAMEPDQNAIIEDARRRNRAAALQRGKEAFAQQLRAVQEKETTQQLHQDRLRQVRELEDQRSSLIAKLPPHIREQQILCDSTKGKVNQIYETTPGKTKKTKKLLTKKSPGRVIKSYVKVVGSDHKLRSPLFKPTDKSSETMSSKNGPSTSRQHSESDPTTVLVQSQVIVEDHTEPYRKSPRTTVPILQITPTKADKIARYNPDDYTKETSDTTTSDSCSSISDDSSYFSDSSEQTKSVKTPKYRDTSTNTKIRLYDHSTHQRNVYDKPAGVVEKIDPKNERSAIDLAREIEQAESIETELLEKRKCSAQKRGEDALLREKVRRDYAVFMQELDKYSREERKLKASQIQSYPNDVHLREQHRKMLREHHKKKLERGLKNVLNHTCSTQYSSRIPERIITLTPQEDETSDTIPEAVWQDSYGVSNGVQIGNDVCSKSKEDELSREEQILDMLKKVERQKRLLLQEFGADLPSDIFNVSVKPLFETEKVISSQKMTSPEAPELPEIRVINMSSCEDISKCTARSKDKSPVKKVEIAVQTITAEKDNTFHDKSIQVKLDQEKLITTDSVKKDTDIKTSKHYPIEPKVTIITTQVDSSDTSSSVTGITIDIDNEQIKVTPNKQKVSIKQPKRVSKKKSRSVPSSKMSSPVKKSSKSLADSQQSSPKKASSSRSEPSSKRKDVNKTGYNIRVEPFQATRVAVERNAVFRMKDPSDTSTSFASPPPVQPRNILEALVNHTPILELLDSSANEALKVLKRSVSPVSDPATPSPRTMMMPSNRIRPERIRRILKYSYTDSQSNESTNVSSARNDQSTTTDQLSDYQREEFVSPRYVSSSKQQSVSSKSCSCKKPECKLAHPKLDTINDFAQKNDPEIRKMYEDLENMCTDRIASLADLIDRLRSEQRGMELSVIPSSDETHLMRLPSPTRSMEDLQSLRGLVENVQAIYNELSQGLLEPKKISESDVTSQETIVQNESKAETQKAKTKPKIIGEERVNIQLDRFKFQKRHQASMMPSTSEQKPEPPQKLRGDDMIQKLSKELLEETEVLSKSSSNSPVLKDINNSLIKINMQTIRNTNDSNSSAFQRVETNVKVENTEPKEKDYVPMLADIPKVVPSIIGNSSISGRGKPPVSLLSAAQRTELIEPTGHELSTIVEFDTPDNANKSLSDPKSPSQIKKSTETQSTKSPMIVKPSVREVKCHEYSSTETFSAFVPVAHKEQETTTVCNPFNVCKDIKKSSLSVKDEEGKWADLTPEKSNKKLQCNTVNQELLLRPEDVQPTSSVSTDANHQYKSNKDKITSTSSNSFSGLSGISEIISTPSSEFVNKNCSSPEEMEMALKKHGLRWAITTLKKTREASALSSSSNSDVTPINTARRMISPTKTQPDNNTCGLLDFSDVSSISIKEASKSTEQAVLLKGRTSTPKLHNSNSNSARTNSSSTNSSENFQEPSDSLVVPNMSLTKAKSNIRKLENL